MIRNGASSFSARQRAGGSDACGLPCTALFPILEFEGSPGGDEADPARPDCAVLQNPGRVVAFPQFDFPRLPTLEFDRSFESFWPNAPIIPNNTAY